MEKTAKKIKKLILEQGLSSIYAQTLTNLEIICVYKESKDNTYSILKSFKKQDPRISIIKRNSGGPGGARSFGMALAKGDYVAFVDGDDFIAVGIFEIYLKKRGKKIQILLCAVSNHLLMLLEKKSTTHGAQHGL